MNAIYRDRRLQIMSIEVFEPTDEECAEHGINCVFVSVDKRTPIKVHIEELPTKLMKYAEGLVYDMEDDS